MKSKKRSVFLRMMMSLWGMLRRKERSPKFDYLFNNCSKTFVLGINTSGTLLVSVLLLFLYLFKKKAIECSLESIDGSLAYF